MAFDKLKNFLNVDIKDGVPGKAIVQSSSEPTESGTSGNVWMWLDVYVEGWEPYRIKHHCMVKKTKHPWPGETLPVIVDRDNKERIDIQWDQVKTVDEEMREGTPPAALGETDLGALFGGANVTIQQGETIDLTGTEVGDQIMEALRAQGVVPDAGAPEADDRISQLERLTKLRESGALTEAEFEAEKARILGGG